MIHTADPPSQNQLQRWRTGSLVHTYIGRACLLRVGRTGTKYAARTAH
jgi:hypothetical protein